MSRSAKRWSAARIAVLLASALACACAGAAGRAALSRGVAAEGAQVAGYRWDAEIDRERQAAVREQRQRDQQILERSRLVLSRHPCVFLRGLRVSVHGGRVVLEGSAGSQLELRTAIQTVLSLPGVTAVESHLQVAAADDSALELVRVQRLEQTLRSQPELTNSGARVELKDGRVHVLGRVVDPEQLDALFTAVYRVAALPVAFDLEFEAPRATAPKFLWSDVELSEPTDTAPVWSLPSAGAAPGGGSPPASSR